MRMVTLAAAALMCSASAFAQTGPAQADVPAAAQSTTEPSSGPTTAAPTMSPDAPPAPTAPGAAASTDAVTSMSSGGSVDIAAHDGNKDGALSPLEFGMAMKGSDTSLSAEAKRERFSRASGNGAIKLLNETAADFAKADRNQDKRVDSGELAMLHSGGMTSGAGSSAPITSGAGSMSSAPSPDTGATTGATMNSSPSGAPDAGTTSDSPTATDSDVTDPSNPNTTATVPPTEPKN